MLQDVFDQHNHTRQLEKDSALRVNCIRLSPRKYVFVYLASTVNQYILSDNNRRHSALISPSDVNDVLSLNKPSFNKHKTILNELVITRIKPLYWQWGLIGV